MQVWMRYGPFRTFEETRRLGNVNNSSPKYSTARLPLDLVNQFQHIWQKRIRRIDSNY